MARRIVVGPAGASAIIAMCFCVSVLEGFDLQVIGIVAPQLVPYFKLNPQQAGLAFSASTMGLVIGAVFFGWLADRVGRKRVLMGSVAAFGIFSLATMVAQDYGQLFLCRLLTGVGIGGAMPNLIAIASEITPKEKRTGVTALMFSGMPLGGGSVALLALLAPGLDWRTVFGIGGLLPLVLVPLLAFGMKEEVVAAPAAGAPKVATVNPLAVLFGGGRLPATLLLWVTYFMTLIVLYLLLNWLPTLVVAKGMTKADGSLVSLVFNIASVVGAIAIGRGVDRFGMRWPLALTYVLLVGSTMMMAQSPSLLMFAIAAGAAGFFVIGAQYSLYGIAPAYYPAGHYGTGAGAAVAVGRLGSIVGPMVGGQLLGAGASPSQVIAALTPVAIIAGLAVVGLSFIKRRTESV
jgi:AAHS family 3-hydroxyphenylpropionic acid transporter